jgi:hypothetical protein
MQQQVHAWVIILRKQTQVSTPSVYITKSRIK